VIIAEAPVEVFEEIDSTLLEARRRAEAGELSPIWLIAKRQSAGKGRRGRSWASVDGNLLATYLSATDRKPAEIALFGFAIGLALAETADHYLGAGRATLKWPNDVMIDGAKAAGILIDSGATNGVSWAALAFGFNIAGAPDDLDQATSSLRAALPTDAPTPAPLDVLLQIRTRLMIWDARLTEEGFAPLREAWLDRAHRLGEHARVAIGEQVREGKLNGLTERGELELLTAEGLVLIAAGDILLPQASAV
jgi:BirA family biotin operon repressor/biotin-[acetyl-CoA-carboxylase] ligase